MATLYTSHVTERDHFLRSPTKDTDWLVLTTDGDSDAIRSGLPTWEDRLFFALALIGGLLFVVNLVAPHGSVLKSATSVAWIVVAVIDAPVLFRRFRRNYRLPQSGRK